MRYPSVLYGFVSLLLIFCLLTGAAPLYAQQPKPIRVHFQDSLMAGQQSNLLGNTIRIENPGYKSIRLGVSIQVPEGWNHISARQNGGGKAQVYTIAGREQLSIPVNLLKTPKTLAHWDSVQIRIFREYERDTQVYRYYIKLQTRSDFILQKQSEDILLQDGSTGLMSFEAYIKNTGNVHDAYQIRLENRGIGIEHQAVIFLKAGRDTIVRFQTQLKPWALKSIYRESVYLRVTNDSGKTQNQTFTITRPTDELTQYKSAYDVIPLTLGGGALSLGEDLNYYGAISASYRFGDHYIWGGYRTRQMGTLFYGYQPNVIDAGYSYRGWTLAAGQVRAPRDFIVIGQGISLSYSKSMEKGFAIGAILHQDIPENILFRNDLYFASARYFLGKTHMVQNAMMNVDNIIGLRSYILDNQLEVVRRRNISLKLLAAGSMEEKTREAPGQSKMVNGFGLGYQLSMAGKRLSLISGLQLYNPDYAGLNKGRRSQLHEASLQIRKTSRLSLFYESDFLERNVFRDSLYQSDYLSNNISRMGVGFLMNRPHTELSLRAGLLQQKGSMAFYAMDEARFINLMFSWKSSRHTSFRFISNNAFTPGNAHKPIDKLISNTSLTFESRYAGFQALYNVFPMTAGPAQAEQSRLRQTLYGGPFLRFSAFRNALNMNMRYQISRSITESEFRHGMGGQISLNLPESGLSFSLGGYYPFAATSITGLPVSEQRYGSLSLSKRINVPIVVRKKYHDLCVVLFYDQNDNNVYDEGETLISDAMVVIGDKTFVTNASGTLRYNNIPERAYELNLLYVRKDGLIPIHGPLQTISMQRKTRVEIPFRKGRMLQGNLAVDADSLSTIKLSPDGFKIIITDSAGRRYSALTDMHGNFTTYLPNGLYTVSLNPQIFEGTDFKPVRMSYEADLLQNTEAFIQFTVRQKRRQVNFRTIEMKKK